MFRLIIISILSLLPFNFHAQSITENVIRIAFYNLENLFDTEDDSLTHDEEFTPEGARHWEDRRFYRKVHSTFKVLAALGEWEAPAFAGFCEVENRECVQSLIYDSPFRNTAYKVVHFDSPDRRGIDVAAIYREDVFRLLVASPLQVGGKNGLPLQRRNVLYVQMETPGPDTLHIFVNHWPSRYGGYSETAGDRLKVAEIVKDSIDHIMGGNKNSKIIIMGDFNDNPTDESLLWLTGRHNVRDEHDSALVNLMERRNDLWQGTLKFSGEWFTFDQIVVSRSLLVVDKGLIISGDAQIFDPDFLLEDDLQYTGKRPYRTYNGFKYNGGFSDHLPVFLDLKIADFP